MAAAEGTAALACGAATATPGPAPVGPPAGGSTPTQWCWLRLHGLCSPPSYIVSCDATARGSILVDYVAMLLGREPATVQLLYLNIPVRPELLMGRQVIPAQAEALIQVRDSASSPWLPLMVLPPCPAASCPLNPTEQGVYALFDQEGWTLVAGSILQRVETGRRRVHFAEDAPSQTQLPLPPPPRPQLALVPPPPKKPPPSVPVTTSPPSSSSTQCWALGPMSPPGKKPPPCVPVKRPPPQLPP